MTEALTAEVGALASENITAVFTSGNAVERVADILGEDPKWEVFCIDGSTKDKVARFFGVDSVKGSAPDGEALAKEIIRQRVRNVVFFCGEARLDTLPRMLSAEGVEVLEIVVYKTVATPSATGKEYDGVVFFSPSAVDSYFSMNQPSAATVLFSIGATTSAAIRRHAGSSNTIVTSSIADKNELIREATRYLNNL